MPPQQSTSFFLACTNYALHTRISLGGQHRGTLLCALDACEWTTEYTEKQHLLLEILITYRLVFKSRWILTVKDNEIGIFYNAVFIDT